MAKNKKKKLPPGITEEFIDSVNGLDSQGRKTLIFELQKGIEEARAYLDTNEGVLEAKAQLDMVAGPARDTIKSLKNRNKFILDQMKLNGEL